MSEDPTNAQPNSDAGGDKGQNAGTVLTDPAAAAGKVPAASGTPDPAAAGQDPAEGAADPKDPKDPAKPEGAPEKYEAFKVPEGLTLNPGMTSKLEVLAKEFSLSQEKTQRLVDLAAEHTLYIQQQQQEKWAEIRTEWVKAIQEDKTFGGEKFAENHVRAQRALSTFDPDGDFKELLKQGYGDNPAIFKFLVRIDQATSEDRLVDGAPAKADDSRSAADVIYGGK